MQHHPVLIGGLRRNYGVFSDGRYELNKAIMDLHDWLELQTFAALEKPWGRQMLV
jgi:hypothetical protein